MMQFQNLLKKIKSEINKMVIKIKYFKNILDVVQKQKEDEYLSRLFVYNQDERSIFYLGLLASAANGCAFPIFSLFLSEMIEVLS